MNLTGRIKVSFVANYYELLIYLMVTISQKANKIASKSLCKIYIQVTGMQKLFAALISESIYSVKCI